MATATKTAKKSTKKVKVEEVQATVNVAVEATAVVEPTALNADEAVSYTSVKKGRVILKGNVGILDENPIRTSKEGKDFLVFPFAVNSKNEQNEDVTEWYQVRTSLLHLQAALKSGSYMKIVGNHFVVTRTTDGKVYNRLNAFEISFL